VSTVDGGDRHDGVMTTYPEPPAIGTEAETLLGSLERQRATFAHKCADLDADQLRRRFGASAVTIGGLLKHLAYMEDLNFTANVAARPLPAPWSAFEADGRGEDVWRSAAGDRPGDLYRWWEEAVARSREAVLDALARGGPGVTFDEDGSATSLRRLVVDFIEEYARHTGHADLIRESIDGRVGEDPPGRPEAFRLG
jgi:uncharacterized damage-inducible protein DinB